MENNPSHRQEDRKAIMAHIESIFRAFIDKNREKIEATHLPQWKGFTVRSRKTIRSREEYMAEIEPLLENQHWKFFEISEDDIAFYGDTAVVSYITRISGKDPHERYFETKLRVMDIYIKTDSGWNLAASSVSLHPDIIDDHLNAAISTLTLS